MANSRLWIVVFSLLIADTHGQAPHEDSSLKPWSDANTWTGGKPGTGQNVEIKEAILMDEGVLNLSNITIEAGGRLVFDPRVNINLSVRNIFVYGSLQIGSEQYPYDGQLSITLTGTIVDHGTADDGKVIKVFNGGSLDIHGKPKLSWTKLTSTAFPLKDSGEFVFKHKTDIRYKNQQVRREGVAAYTISLAGVDPVIKQFGVYTLFKHGDMLAQQINGMADGEVLMMTSQRIVNQKTGSVRQTQAYDALETLLYGQVTGQSVLRTLPTDGSTWALIVQKGNPNAVTETSNPVDVDSEVELKLADAAGVEYLFGAVVSGPDTKKPRRNDFSVVSMEGLFPKLDLLEVDGTWMAGEEIVIAPTDSNPYHAETVQVAPCDDCGPNQIRIDRPLRHKHFGEILYGTVDMRAEVGMLSRNIVIQGQMESSCPVENGNCNQKQINGDTFGAHIKVLEGYANVRIEGVELRNVGQQTATGKYPIHFHLCLDPAENATTPYVKSVSIHHSFARCITVHGSHQIQIMDIVCYDHIGHGIFLEDGGELDTVVDGNLVLMTRSGPGLTGEPTDLKNPTSYWITNPRTHFCNNVAAGSEANGIWVLFPKEPLPPSRQFDIMGTNEASRTNFTAFENNVAHSNLNSGLLIKGKLLDDRTIVGGNQWQPRENSAKDSSTLTAKIDRITGDAGRIYVNLNWCLMSEPHKKAIRRHYRTGDSGLKPSLKSYMNKRNIWIEGGLIDVTRVSSADSMNGIVLTNPGLEKKFSGRLFNSVFLGESANFQNFMSNAPRSGITTWKGPIKIENVWFSDFPSRSKYDLAAIAKRRNSPYFFSITTSVKNALFAFDDGPTTGSYTKSGNKDRGWVERDGLMMSGFTYYNQTGSQTGVYQRLYVVKPDHLSAAAADCRLRPNWRMAVCTTKYGNWRLKGEQLGHGVVYVRDDLPSAQLPFQMKRGAGPPVVLDGSRAYTVHFNNTIPREVELRAEGMELGDVLRVGICLPPTATFDLKLKRPFLLTTDQFVRVGSLAELDATSVDDGKKIYYDNSTGMLYYKYINPLPRDADERNTCPNGDCPTIIVTIHGGDVTDADCRERLYGNKLNMPKPPLPLFDDIIPANGGSLPPTGWGAGPTKPFTNRGV